MYISAAGGGLSMKLAMNLYYAINVIGKATKQSDPRWWFKT